MHLDPISRDKPVRDFQSSPLTIVLMSIVGLSKYPPTCIETQNAHHVISLQPQEELKLQEKEIANAKAAASVSASLNPRP